MSVLKTVRGEVITQSEEFACVVIALKERYTPRKPTQSSHATQPASGIAPAIASAPMIPFIVILTYEERYQAPFAKRLYAKLRPLLESLAKIASGLGGVVGATGATLAVLLQKVTDADDKLSLKELLQVFRTSRENAPSFEDVKKQLEAWKKDGVTIDPSQIKQADWEQFWKDLETQAGEIDDNEISQDKTPFSLTQVTGWLDPEGQVSVANSGFKQYGFTLQGELQFESAEIRDNARFDILGPDGSQLATAWLDGKTVKALVEDPLPDPIPVDGSSDLRRALSRVAEVQTEAQRLAHYKKEANGRIWRSDGIPIGQRSLAIFAPPAFARPVDPECLIKTIQTPNSGAETPQPDEDNDDCCSSTNDSLIGPIVEAPLAIAFATTDEAGYFTFSYEKNLFDKRKFRHVLLHISGVRTSIAIKLLPGDHPFPVRILLPIDADLFEPETDRDAITWVDGEQVKEDSCSGRNFTEANRVLDEFDFPLVVRTTDPLIRRGALFGKDTPVPAIASLFRHPMDRGHQIQWDEEPVITQAVTISHGRILTIKQKWRSDGYSLGDLLYSLPLAPLQKKNIAIVDWNRVDLNRLDVRQTDAQDLNNFVGRERDITEIVNSSLSESVRGRSESSGSASSGGVGGFFGSLFGGGSSGSSSAWSTSSQESTRALAASMVNRLRDNTMQAASAYRSLRTTSVQQASQSERSTAFSETVANRNACHAVTIQYFEVLRHLRIDFELASVRECLYIPLPIEPFNEAKILRWEGSLRPFLPPAQVEGMDAMLRIKNAFNYPGARYADEPVTHLEGEMQMLIDLPLPSALLAQGMNEYKLPEDYKILQAALGILPVLFSTPISRRDAFFTQNIAPVIARRLVAGLKFFVGPTELPVEATLTSNYQRGGLHAISLRWTGKPSGLKRSDIGAVHIRSTEQVPVQSLLIVKSASMRYRTAHYEGSLFDRTNENNSIRWSSTAQNFGDDATISTPCTVDELRNPKEEDVLAAARLKAHLDEFVERYHKVIWATMDPDRRFTLLDGFIAPNAGGRSVASVVENRVVGIVGNCLVMPVAPGLRLDYFTDIREDTEAAEGDLLSLYQPLVPNPSLEIAIPTKGVFAESVMGGCNACEKIDDSRNWRYWEHPLPDEPTPIDALSLGTRDRPTTPVVPNVPAPMVQQAVSQLPAAPDPGGLANAIGAVSNGAAFRDATGLAGTQQNAREALADSFATTQAFGSLAAQLQMKAMELIATALGGVPVSSDPAKVKESIGRDAKAGRITKEQAQNAIAKVNDSMAENLAAQRNSDVLNYPDVAAAIATGVERGSALSLRRGNTSVEVGESRSAPEEQITPVRTARSRWPWSLLRPSEAEASVSDAQRDAQFFAAMWKKRTDIEMVYLKSHEIYASNIIQKHATDRHEDGTRYLNMCATRISIVLHEVGLGHLFVRPYSFNGKTSPTDKTLRPYIAGAEDLAARLTQKVGPPLKLLTKADRANYRRLLDGKQGIVLLQNYYPAIREKDGDHIELWNMDHLPKEYWHPEQQEAYPKCDAILLWTASALRKKARTR
ncbi:hypothetical protein HNP48_002689 [Acidovorax soli]|uniref:Uncharacterized protein n=1 Tax=Acidovorax soli TaxID=592050 RepID=A0A7X0PED2_9BURK|nr:T6SS effector amidase Tae4 family protein [Acidovorax soli]MBB6560017.1 hypothetical protein [Acidovorax soli]